MSGGVSPSTGRRYPLTMVCTVFRVARSTVYAAPSPRPAGTLGKRGPKTATSDAELVGAIRAVLAATPFHGEGYRKVRARLAHRGFAVGRFGKDAARGLRIRCDWGPQYIADAWINEVKWLGMTISPSYVGEPECNGVIERFMRTLKEQCLYLHQFQTLAEAQRLIAEFITRYNAEWLIERLGHRTPAAARAAALAA